MKTIRFKFILALTMIMSISTFSSCKKKEQKEEKDSDMTSSSDQSFASTTVNDMTSISDEAGRNYSISSFKMVETNGLLSASCATVSVDTLLAAKTITVDFGVSNCLGNDGRYRRGTLVISFTGKYRDFSTIITVTPKNYFVNDNQIIGSKTIINKGYNAVHNIVYQINANITIVKGTMPFTTLFIKLTLI